MAVKARFWNAVLVVLSAANLIGIWFAAQAGEPLHATTHAALAVAFGLWAQRRTRLDQARVRDNARETLGDSEIAALQDELEAARRELGEMQERLDFAERLLTQTGERERLPE